MAAGGDRGELTHLYAVVYRRLGEGPTRLFLRNYGQRTPDLILQGPDFQAVLAQAPAIPAAQRLRWFVDELSRVTGPYWAPTHVSEEADAVYLALEYCPICAEIRGVSAPICSDGVSFCGALARRIVGRRVRVAEVACVALGAPHCTYAFYK